MSLSFNSIKRGGSYSRPQLADLWGYSGYQALARGVVTPRGSNKIILFVTQEKQSSLEQYEDRLEGNRLRWEGPTDHFAEQRMLEAGKNGEEIHVFYRKKHHSEFTYLGQAQVIDSHIEASRPSRFTFKLG